MAGLAGISLTTLTSRSLDGDKNAILDGCSTVDSKLDYDGIGWYSMVFDGIRWYSMVLHGNRWYFAIE